MYLEVRNINKSFENKKVLKHVNIALDKNEITVLLGPNGAGKTTLMNIMMGLLKADSGSIILEEQELKIPYTKKEKRNFFFMPDEPIVMEYLTGFENLEYICEIYKASKTKEELEIILKEVNLQADKNKLVKDYSRGMRQRLCLGYLKIYQPDIILMDEPTIGIDIFGIQELITFLKKLKTEGKTILIASHDMSFCNQCADKAIFINEGEILNVDEKDNIIQKYDSIEKAIVVLAGKDNKGAV